MPIVGVEDKRKQQLIDAALSSIAELGLQKTTILSISQRAGMSSGIISHYFGGKERLVEAALKHLLHRLGRAFVEKIQQTDGSPNARILCIIEANFTEFQRSELAAKIWLSFWARSMHEPGLKRLQQINNARLCSNLRYAYAQFMSRKKAQDAARQTAAMIDGFWLRSALSHDPDEDFAAGESLCKAFALSLLPQ